MPRSPEGVIEQRGPESAPMPVRPRITKAGDCAIKRTDDAVLRIGCAADSLSLLDDVCRQGRQFLEILAFAMGHLEGRSQAMRPVSAVFSVARKVTISKTVCTTLLVGDLEGCPSRYDPNVIFRCRARSYLGRTVWRRSWCADVVCGRAIRYARYPVVAVMVRCRNY